MGRSSRKTWKLDFALHSPLELRLALDDNPGGRILESRDRATRHFIPSRAQDSNKGINYIHAILRLRICTSSATQIELVSLEKRADYATQKPSGIDPNVAENRHVVQNVVGISVGFNWLLVCVRQTLAAT